MLGPRLLNGRKLSSGWSRRHLIFSIGYRVASLRELCQSSFEREMFDILVSKGYRVRPQVKVGGYSIDMIIEGAEDRRIAIECDGDQYHGPERWSADMARQRVLERAGWTFWRCFASSFNIKRKDVLNDLFVTLTNMGIEPIGSIDLDLSQYVEHRTADPFNVSETIQQVVDSPLQLKSQYPELEPSVAVNIISKAADPSQSKIDDNLGVETQIKEKVKESQKDAIESDQGKKQSISKSFSEDSFRLFLDRHGIQAKDNRGKNGALWVFLERNNDTLAKQLCSWGFQFKSGKGWWKA
jgi:very-short-patch-repair endonuclease